MLVDLGINGICISYIKGGKTKIKLNTGTIVITKKKFNIGQQVLICNNNIKPVSNKRLHPDKSLLNYIQNKKEFYHE